MRGGRIVFRGVAYDRRRRPERPDPEGTPAESQPHGYFSAVRNFRKRALQFGVLAACIVVLAGCGSKGDASAGEKEPAAPVEVATAKAAAMSNIVSAEAIVYPFQQANIMPKISAPVQRFYAQRGDHVRKGQLLAVLDNSDLKAAANESLQLYKQAEANYDIAKSSTVPESVLKAKTDLASARQALDAAKRVYQSREKLVQEGALADQLAQQSKVAMVQAQAAFDTAQKHLKALESGGRLQQLASAEAQMQAAKAHYENAEAQLSYSEVRSPITGVVADRPLYVGQMASSGTALFTIVDISKVVARASVPVQEAAAMQRGQTATISGPGATLHGKVTVVSPAVDPSTTTVEVWAEAPNPGERIKPGETARVSVNVSNILHAVVVPAGALLASEEGGDMVMIAGPDGHAHESKVKTGIRSGGEVQIVSGVQPGERVIVQGGIGLPNGAPIKVVASHATASAADSTTGGK